MQSESEYRYLIEVVQPVFLKRIKLTFNIEIKLHLKFQIIHNIQEYIVLISKIIEMRLFVSIICTILMCIIFPMITVRAMITVLDNNTKEPPNTTPSPEIIVAPTRRCPPGEQHDSLGKCRKIFAKHRQ
ncbi:hypothetical protein V1477_013332 [Vespula maculifrons]|uniref:Uncharacterized protein n=1 Tax=Vespula maculifrons TaxID=7453 RepID=A0ABD2BQL5_VESMC